MEEKRTALIPLEEQKVDFYGDELTTALVELDDQVQMYIPLRPICEHLGLSWSGQRERTLRDLVLAEVVRFVRLSRTNRGGDPETLCIPLDFLNGWLFGISASRVKAEMREKVVQYQRDCYHVLYQAFQAESLVVRSTHTALSTLEQIREMGLAIARMAEQQIEMEQRINARIDRAAHVVGDIQRRLGIVERKLTPALLISDEQAEIIAATVKALAMLMSEKDSSKNHYQGIFSELYRRFGVSSYKNIHLEQYEQVLGFLEDWRRAVGEK